MAQFIDEKYGLRDVFEIVDEFPQGYVVWNIGRANFPHPGYIPVARPDYCIPYRINRKYLKAVKCSDEGEALYILKCASFGGFGKNGMGKEEYERCRREYRKNQPR